ncbi:dephospho-CoA kinase [Clostridium sp. KNHs214]|uniref:dephospho-CoA kinase n=1 Tax=Clostridium sp. KNHs214 TaxID=1540257 RepID=UPI0005580E2D|nr:dephospho-CoA kinase [Clostridium sp. KNHs214]
MLKIGLTGGVGSGKSTVSNILREQGIKIIDADLISREVLNIYPEIKEKIKAAFGEDFLDEEGNLERRQLGNYIFKQDERRKKLERIIMPYIKKEIDLRFEAYEKSGEYICVLDAPTLIEQDIYKHMHKNILVWVDRNTQIKRVMTRDDFTEKQVLDRIKSQMHLDEKKKHVDFIIDNSKDLLNTRKQINNIIAMIKKDEGH